MAKTLNTGDSIDDFELPDQDANTVRLSELAATGPVVLFFYPAAMTSGCTAESCHFRDLKKEFADVGAHRVGISRDAVEKQKRFSDKHDFDYPLLSDADGTVAKRFGVAKRLPIVKVSRSTFVIGTDMKLLGRIDSMMAVDRHADDALKILRELKVS